ncbi:nerve growth factor receptor b [Electrophorus electricus]|nr:nerve growth factor receptor b [Electrophorus electricus]
MFTVILPVLLGLVGVFSHRLSSQEVCLSGQYTTSGECCKQCQPGEGMVHPCGETQTVCGPCLDSETFSEIYSHTERCMPCTVCEDLLRMETPCTDANDAVCVCDYGYYLSLVTLRCEACTMCGVGQGVLLQCKHNFDTMCEVCMDDTFSDEESALDPCLPCTTCEEEGQLQACTSVSDTICKVDLSLLNVSVSPMTSVEPSPPPFTDSTLDPPVEVRLTESLPVESGATVDPESRKLGVGLADNLLPVYVSIVPAVLLGFVAFVVFKRWNSCKHSKQEGNNRSGAGHPSQTPSPEGEKLHSDSGISVDSQSLQEGQGVPHTVIRIDGGSALSLPLHTCEEVERLLNPAHGGEGVGSTQETDWCSLAGLLGYEEERIASFRQEGRPVQALLSDWARQDSASVDALCTALRKINREDIAQSILLKPTATSAV